MSGRVLLVFGIALLIVATAARAQVGTEPSDLAARVDKVFEKWAASGAAAVI
jgi:hypothetical protein